MTKATKVTEATRIVVADDSELFRNALAAFLAEIPGLIVVGMAGDGEEVLDLVAALRPHVVFMDVVMPRRDGLTATRTLKSRDNPPVVVVCTSLHNPQLRQAALAAGADAFVLKRNLASEILKLLPALTGAAAGPTARCGGQ